MMTEENTQAMQQENEAEEETNVFDASRQAADLAVTKKFLIKEQLSTKKRKLKKHTKKHL